MSRFFNSSDRGNKYDRERVRRERRDAKMARRAERRDAKLAGIDPATLPEAYQGLARTLMHGGE